MIPILAESAWREFRGASNQKGQNQTIHQALIADAAGVEHLCYVKASPHGNPMAFTEGIAWMIAEALDLPRPPFAALIHLPVYKLRQCMPLDQHWMQYKTVLAFCSSSVGGQHITSRFKWLYALRTARALKHPDVARIAAFDYWVENQDRHTGNFLKTHGGKYIPIDNELILYTLVWVASGFGYGHNSLRGQAQAILNHKDYKDFTVSMALAAKQHEAGLVSVASSLQAFILNMVPNSVTAQDMQRNILGFLRGRADPTWLAGELGCIV